LNTQLFKEAINIVVDALTKAGYDPHKQLWEYILTGDLSYITRQGNARAIVSTLNINDLRKYLEWLNQ
jgi:uncharacterized protein (UPF0297 family)